MRHIVGASMLTAVLLLPLTAQPALLGAEMDEVAPDASGLTWAIDGSPAPRQLVLESFHGHTIEVELPASMEAAAATASIDLACRDRDSGRSGVTPLAIVGRAPGAEDGAARGPRLSVATGEAVARLPYPIEGLEISSKPSAIISQRAGRSVIGLDAATLRDLYEETAGYMITTAGHHYPVPYGDGVLDCSLTAMTGEQDARSRDFEIVVGRGAPDGPFPRSRRLLPVDLRPWWVADPATLPIDIAASVGEAMAGIEAQDVGVPAGVAADPLAARRWDDGSAVGPWMAVTLDLLGSGRENPVRSARALALVAIAANDALLALDIARAGVAEGRAADVGADSRDVFEHVVVAAAVEPILRETFPTLDPITDAAVEDAARARLAGGLGHRVSEAPGSALGAWVAARVIDHARTDGAAAVWGGSLPADPDLWVTSLPTDAPPLEPLAGAWRTWNIASGAAFRPPAPPRPGEPAFERELDAVRSASNGLTRTQQQIASQWQDKDGTLTPAGHWAAIALQLARADGWSSSETALLFALLGSAQADAFIAAFDAKYAYWSIRPITLLQGEDPRWRPYVDTPHFPSYVSGHATTSGAAGAVLSVLFPKAAAELTACADQAAESRLLGGIHFPIENNVGLALGRTVASVALGRVTPSGILPAGLGEPATTVGCLWPAQ